MTLKKNLKLLKWFNFFTDFKLYAPIAIIYFSHITHSYAIGASIFAVTQFSAAFMDVPAGIFADRMGRKKSIIIGALTAVLSVLFYAFGINFWILAIGAIFEGLSRAFYSGNNNALLHGMLAEDGLEHEYNEHLGKLSSMFQIALATSGLIGSFIASWSFPLIMWLSVIPQVLCLAISFQITESRIATEKKGNLLSDLQDGIKSFINNINLRLLSLSSILDYALGETTYQFQAAFYNTLLPIWAVGIAKITANACGGLGFHFSGKLVKKFGSIPILFFGEIYNEVVSFFALIVVTKISPFLLASSSFFYGTRTVTVDTLMQKEFTDKQRATMSSLNSFAGSLLFGIFVFMTGLFADKVGPRNAMLIIQILCLSRTYLVWKLTKLPKRY
jgi:MFS family permease